MLLVPATHVLLLLAATLRALSSLSNKLGQPVAEKIMAAVHYDLLVRRRRAPRLHGLSARPRTAFISRVLASGRAGDWWWLRRLGVRDGAAAGRIRDAWPRPL